MGDPAERLRHARELAGYTTARQAASAMGVTVATYVQHENGTRGYPASRADRYAKFFRTTPEWLLYGRGAEPDASNHVAPKTVPVVGYVGAGAAAHFYDNTQGPLDHVEAPEGATVDTVAAEIRGPSVGRLFDGWLLFYGERRAGVTPDMIGELCVVGLPDERVLVKQIQSSRTPGLFHLLSENEAPILDQEVVWAALVTGLRRR